MAEVQVRVVGIRMAAEQIAAHPAAVVVGQGEAITAAAQLAELRSSRLIERG